MGFYFPSRQFFLIWLGALVIVVGRFVAPRLLHKLLYRYRDIREGTPEDAERIERVRQRGSLAGPS